MDNVPAVCGCVLWNGEMQFFANRRFADDFKSAEEMQYQHKQGAVAPWLLWAR